MNKVDVIGMFMYMRDLKTLLPGLSEKNKMCKIN